MENKLVPYHALAGLPCEGAICFAPHPDDEVFGCGGALALHVQARCQVNVVVVSDGAFAAENKLHVITTREAESSAAAVVLGYPTPTFWRLPDRGVEYSESLIARLIAAIQNSGADLVYAPALSEMHPDHRALAMAAVEAVRRIGGELRLAQYEVGVPLVPNTLIDITPVRALKQAAMRCFPSQLLAQAYDEHIAALNRFRTYTLAATVKAAEAYSLHSAQDLVRAPLELFASEYVRQARLGLPVSGSRDLPLVSIIVRSWGGQLTDSLDAIALQTYPNIEVLVVSAKEGDGNALDTLCGRFPLRQLNKPGALLDRAEAGNLGLDAAKGQYLAMLDAGDLLTPEHVAKLVQRLSNETTGVAYSGCRIENEQGQLVRVLDESWLGARLRGEYFVPLCAILFSRHVLESGCRFFSETPGDEDWDFCLQMAQLGIDFVHKSGQTVSCQRERVSAKAQMSDEEHAALHNKWLNRWKAKQWAETHAWCQQQALNNADEGLMLRGLQSQLAKTQEALTQKNEQIQVITEQYQHWQRTSLQLEQERLALINSRSWRLTAGLRWIKAVLR